MSTLQPLSPQTESSPLGFPTVVVPQVPTLPTETGKAAEPSQLLVEEQGRAGQGRGASIPTKKPSSRYQSLDLWRGAACLMLVLYHSTFYGEYLFRVSNPSSWSVGGLPLYLIRMCWIGVPVFFVISGYCISASVDSLSKRPHSIRDYFVRRFRRIYPPLWIMCGLAVLFTYAMSFWPVVHSQCEQLPSPFEFSLSQWAGNILAFESWRHNITGGQPTYLMANTWTLCYEEQFYFLTGVMLAAGGRRFFRLAAWTTGLVFVGRHVLMACGIRHEGFFWDGHWIMFAAGIFVYHTLNCSQSKRRWLPLSVFAAGLIYGAGMKVLADDHFQKHLGEYLFVASAFAIFLVFARPWDSWIASRKLLAPLKWCGQRSYSIYLTHFLVVTVASCFMAHLGFKSELLVATVVVPACLLLSLPFAIAFYHGVEKRFINTPLEPAKA